ncbi:MAG: hypothetical protein RR228_00635 [Bacilli bacterium]
MIINLDNIENEDIIVDEKLVIDDTLLKAAGIQRLESTKVQGKISFIDYGTYNIFINATGTMVLLCDLSLEEVMYPFNIKINCTIGENNENMYENVKIIGNTLDILPILWENIILEKPNHIVKENIHIKTSGDGWSLTDNIKTNQLEDLKNILDMEEEK